MTTTDVEKRTLIKVVLETNFALVTYNPVIKLAKIEWKAKASTEEYQSAFIALLEYADKYPIHYFLSDITKQSVVSPENRKWFENIMVPMAMGKGLKKAGALFDGNVFKKYYVNLIIQTTKKLGLPLKVFNSEEEAIKWFLKD
ncbi:MAG: hypothetical protein PF485_11830 [Bacteroidales bacterium]|jgi:hypothetical protein|nr:hypothetical protein [Bacteroidales bacterium]